MTPLLLSAADYLRDAPDFVRGLLAEVAELGLEVEGLDIDHLCLRAASNADYERLRDDFAKFGDLLIEADVNGRPIATFKVTRPIRVGVREIPLVEIPAPKPGTTYETGLEHVEFVSTRPLEEWIRLHPSFPWKTGAMKKAHNPELVLPLAGGRSVKFHLESLESVIAREKAGE